eukprot:9283646-Alexandrium_andersonii.AAC.1
MLSDGPSFPLTSVPHSGGTYGLQVDRTLRPRTGPLQMFVSGGRCFERRPRLLACATATARF